MTGWIVDALLASVLLMAAVLLVRAPVRRAFGPCVAYCLWALPALRLLLPPVPEAWREGPTAITHAGERVFSMVSAASEPVPHPIAEAAPADHLVAAAALFWLAGALAFFLFHLGRYARFRARLLRDRRSVGRVGGVRVVRSPAAHGPLAFGVLHRYVALPLDFGRRYDRQERALALAHELGHHARGDLLANWTALGVLAIHWWNPIAWAAHRAFRADQELANDARVLRGRGGDAAHAYARAILKTAHGGAVAAICHLHTIGQLKGRLHMLKNRSASPRRLLAGGIAVSALAVSGLGLTASGARAAAAVKERVGEAVGVDLQADLDRLLADMPAPPAPPAPPAAASPTPASAQVPPAPPAPPTPPTPTASGERRVEIYRDKDGRSVRYYRFGPNARGFDPSSIPEITSRDCGGGERPVVRDETRDGRRIVVICADRMTRMTDRASREAARAAELAANSPAIERDALAQALEGLRSARTAVEGDAQLTAEQKRDALRGIDQGEREIRESIARGD